MADVNTVNPDNLPSKGIKPIVSLRAHTRLAVIIFCVIMLLGVPVAIIKGKPVYLTTATVQVAPTYMKNIRDK